MSPAIVGLLRGIGFAVLMSILTYFGDASHLTGVVSVALAGTISTLALAIEHMVESTNGKALFGLVRTR